LLLLVLTLSTAFAVDMHGKVGMGVAWASGQSGFVPQYALTKIGLSERFVLEPTLYITSISVSNGGTEDGYSFEMTALFAYAVMANAKSNVYAKAGVGFSTAKEIGSQMIGTSILLPLGFALEHFVSEYFSVDLNARMGLTFMTAAVGEPSIDAHAVGLALGNGAVSAGLLWYY
jgi:hypothetical protein